MKHRNVSSDEEDLQKAVQDLGLVVLGKFHGSVWAYQNI